MFRPRTQIGLGIFLFAATCLACGGVNGPSGSIFTAEEIALFGNGVDYTQDPDRLGGEWKVSWEREQRARIELADAVAVVKIHSVSDDETAGNDPYIRLVIGIESKLFGSFNKDPVLRVERTDPGFPSVDGKSRTLLSQPFVLALRWQRLSEETTEVVPRWHLTPATGPVLEYVRDAIDMTHGGSGAGTRSGRSVVIHNND